MWSTFDYCFPLILLDKLRFGGRKEGRKEGWMLLDAHLSLRVPSGLFLGLSPVPELC